MRQTLEGSFSAVSKPNFASKYALESCRRDLHDAQLHSSAISFFGKKLTKKIEDAELCERVHCVDLGESFPTHIYLQNLASIQPKTSPLKFAGSDAVARAMLGSWLRAPARTGCRAAAGGERSAPPSARTRPCGSFLFLQCTGFVIGLSTNTK